MVTANANSVWTRLVCRIDFPQPTGLRVLMMPYIQGEPESCPPVVAPYRTILQDLYYARGAIGYLTIDESPVKAGVPHRGARAKYGRAIHTEAGRIAPSILEGGGAWGGSTGQWGGRPNVLLSGRVGVMVANNMDDTCAIWDTYHPNTSDDGDIGDKADQYPYSEAIMVKAGEVHNMGIFTPHESLPAPRDGVRQFIRIVSSGVSGTELYFTNNPALIPFVQAHRDRVLFHLTDGKL